MKQLLPVDTFTADDLVVVVTATGTGVPRFPQEVERAAIARAVGALGRCLYGVGAQLVRVAVHADHRRAAVAGDGVAGKSQTFH